ncbi:MAG: carboxylating nicotinate-nucleotide diphosphorylase [Candidatus Gastranaerophilales bacterium]|nr:carboxylating nicotinate-nucleotide diphosphorylase [Candidatus Gastranaerophilales bacterium]
MKYFLNEFLIEEHVKNAIKEDISFFDITTDAIFTDDYTDTVKLVTRTEGILCGIDVVKTVYKIVDPEVKVNILLQDGTKLRKNDTIATITGKVNSILKGERVALNYLQRMSGIATLANKFQKAVEPYAAKIVDTRKTTPGFRLFEKYAVQTGGAYLHRFNLSDCVMLKDNHIKFAGGIKAAIQKVKAASSFAHKIEIEAEDVSQVKEALDAKADIIMLDNMSLDQIKQAVSLINRKAIVEVSGNISLDNIKTIASLGIDIISTSAMQTTAGVLDIGLDA